MRDPAAPEWLDATFFDSARRREGPEGGVAECLAWLERLRRRDPLTVRRIRFAELDRWRFTPPPVRLAHETGRFFSVLGVRVRAGFGPVRQWDQPLVSQPEIGVLGMLTRVVDGVRCFLMQGKMEPGNPNGIQLAPTVQATRSNYGRVHGGALPPLLDYFTQPRGRVLVDELQPEQAARFLDKRNRNMVVEVDHDPPHDACFRWMTLGQIKALLRRDLVVNMDARSVLSAVPQGPAGSAAQRRAARGALHGFAAELAASLDPAAESEHGDAELDRWLDEQGRVLRMEVTLRSLDALRDWRITEDAIERADGRHFRVVAVAAAGGGREVRRWTQPLVRHEGVGIIGMLAARRRGVLHFLMRPVLEPGSGGRVQAGPTVACAAPEQRRRERPPPAMLEHFLDPDPDRIWYSAVQSEEGGRFDHFQNRYMVVAADEAAVRSAPAEFRWVTAAQWRRLASRGRVHIDARSLLACLSLLDP